MIRVHRPRGPHQLSTPIAEVTSERAEALKFHKRRANLKKSFPFKIYKETYIKEAIERIFHNKCAYCESVYIVTQPVDVEHFRPKGAVMVLGKRKKPGYYWLASEWTNLLPSCIRCNRANKYKMPGKKTLTMGKQNFFPLLDEKQRARKPGDERKERRLLLDPCIDYPDRHLEYSDDGIVRAATNARGQVSKKGQTSITTYALSRPDLVERRAEYAKKILAQIERVKRSALYVQQYRRNGNFRKDLRAELDELKAFGRSDREYSAMARQLTDHFIKTVR
jgi:uncharacterized protein (TIGR02646 family)